MQRGGCHPKDGCQDGDAFAGADFQYLAANVEVRSPPPSAPRTSRRPRSTARHSRPAPRRARRARSQACKRKLTKPKAPQSKNLLPPYSIKTVGGVKIGFIGMTLEGTPQLVTPTGVSGLAFRDEAHGEQVRADPQAAGRQDDRRPHPRGRVHERDVQRLRRHLGPDRRASRTRSMTRSTSSSRSHAQAYNCTIDGKLVTSASSFGRVITDIDLTIESTTGEVTAKTATNKIVTRTSRVTRRRRR